MSNEPIADLHCDLLMALAAGKAHSDPDIRCSLGQMQKGKVRWQLLPIFVEGGCDSVDEGQSQADLFAHLVQKHPKDYELGWSDETAGGPSNPPILNLFIFI